MHLRLSRFAVLAIMLSLVVATPSFSQGNRNDQFRRQQQQQQDQWRRQQADEQRRRAQEDQRRQLQQWQQQQRQQMADQQRRQMLETQRQQRMAEMLRQQQNSRLQDAMRAQQAGRPTPGGVPSALANKPTDRMVFPNGVAKLTRPLTPAEVRRGFTGKITPDGRALVKFRNRVFAVPASGLGLKLGSDPAPTRTQLMSGTSLSPAPGTASRLSVKEKTALNGTIQQLVAASNARQAKERVALARGGASKGQQVASGLPLSGGRTTASRFAPNERTWGPATKNGPLPTHIAATFRSSTYTEKVTTEETVLFRVYGGKAGEIGGFWSRDRPGSQLQARLDSALDPKWGNQAGKVVEIRVPPGTTIFEGVAAPQGSLVGGGNQVYIQDVDPTWIKE